MKRNKIGQFSYAQLDKAFAATGGGGGVTGGTTGIGGGGAGGASSVNRNLNGERRYLPTLSDLVDRLSIVQLKAVFIPEHKDEYVKERADLEHDIDLILAGKQVTAADVHAVCIIMLANRFIWENESRARAGGPDQDKLLKLTHSINGVRNTAKNQLARLDGGRRDYKVDCFAAELGEEFGDWNIFA